MTRRQRTLWIACSALALAGAGCGAEAQAEPAGSALQAAGAAGGAAVDRDGDVDERVDEANDGDRDVDEAVDETNDHDRDVDENVDEANDGPNDDFDLTVDELPAAVRATVDAQVGTGTITGIDRDQAANGVEFEVDYTNANGERWELDVAEDGTVVQSKRD